MRSIASVSLGIAPEWHGNCSEMAGATSFNGIEREMSSVDSIAAVPFG